LEGGTRLSSPHSVFQGCLSLRWRNSSSQGCFTN